MTFKRNGKIEKILKLAAFVVAFILLLTIFVPSSQIAFAAPLSDSDIPEDFRNYDFWQFGNTADFKIDLEAIKTQIASWALPADTTNIQPVLIGVIDTGINAAHPLFSKVLYKPLKIANEDGTPIPEAEQTTVTIGYNVVGNSDAIADLSSDRHGTHTAGIIATLILELGLENYIKIVPIRAVDSTNQFTVPNIVSAINWASGENSAQTVLGFPVICDVVNLSLGILSSSIKTSSSWNNRENLVDALETHSATTIFVASAGNDSADSAQNRFYPAAIPGVISVMSYGKTGGFSSTSNFGDYDLIAPGEDIFSASTGSTYANKSGTSMASPYVAFGSALLRLRYHFSQTDKAKFENEPTARQIAKMLRNHSERTLQVNGGISDNTAYDLKVLDLDLLSSADFSLEKYDIGYSDPSRLVLSYEENSLLTQKMDERAPVNFAVAISPQGEYNPVYEEDVEWWVETVNFDNSTSRYKAGNGISFTFSNEMRGGAYNIYATLNYQNKILTSNKQTVTIQYLAPDFEKIKIAPSDRLSSYKGNGTDIPSYVGYTTTLSLTNIEYVDQTVDIEWYVNGVLSGSGTVFNFTPNSAGTHNIVAKYSGHDVYYNFTLQTRLPRISFWLIALIATILGVAAFSFIFLDGKRHIVTENANLENSYAGAINKLFYNIESGIANQKAKRAREIAEKKAKMTENKDEKIVVEPTAKPIAKVEKLVKKCPKCGAYVKYTGEKGKCKYCGTEVYTKVKKD